MTKIQAESVGDRADTPLHTVVSAGMHHGLCAVSMVKMRGQNVGDAADSPLHTVSAEGQHHAVCAAFLAKYYGQSNAQSATAPLHTITTKSRFGLVTVNLAGEPYALVDIGMRMLTPKELARAQGFPDWYVLDEVGGKPVTKTAQVRGIGNSVCPPMAQALAGANYMPAQREVKKVCGPLLAV